MAERIEIVVTTDADKASAKIEDLADQVEELTGTRPEIVVQADTGDAAQDIDAVVEGASTLDGATAAVDVSAPGADQASSDIEGVGAAASDMADEIGLAATPLGDLSGAFGAFAEQAASTMKLSAGSIAALSATIPIVGTAIGAAAQAWDTYKQAQEASTAAAEAQRAAYEDVADALSAGEINDAADALVTATDEIRAKAEGLGVPFEELSAYITGAADSMPSLDSQTNALYNNTDALALAALRAREAFLGTNDAADDTGPVLDTAADAVTDYAEAADQAAGYVRTLAEYTATLTGELDRQADALKVSEKLDDLASDMYKAGIMTQEFGANSEEATDAMRDFDKSAIEAKQSVAEYTDGLGNLPMEVQSEIIMLIDQGKYAEAEAAFDAVTRQRESQIWVEALTAAAEGDLTAVERDRIATITADPNSYTAEGELNATARQRISAIVADPKTGAAESGLNSTARQRSSYIYADAETGTAESQLNHAARDRTSNVYQNLISRITGQPSSGGGGDDRSATGYAVGPAAMTVAPQVTIRVDARGAIDPYSVGRAVEQAAGAWGRVSGSWRPGLRAVRR